MWVPRMHLWPGSSGTAPGGQLDLFVRTNAQRTYHSYPFPFLSPIILRSQPSSSSHPTSRSPPYRSKTKLLHPLSPLTTAIVMSEKVCSHVCSHHKCKRRKLLRLCCAGLLIFTFIVLLIVLIIWAILQPKKPCFVLQDATVFNLTVSAPNVISTTIQITIISRNPNSQIGIYYDKLHVYANYNNQQITYYTGIPPAYQGHKDVNIWSPFICSNDVPVAPYNGVLLGEDQSNGVIKLKFKIDGRVKWKVGSFVSGRYHLHVTCYAYVPLGNSQNTGVIIGHAVKYQVEQSCSVSV